MEYTKYQQGDVLLLKVSKEEFETHNLRHVNSEHETRAVLAEGEATGHYHAIYMDDLFKGAEVTLAKTTQYRRENEGLIVENKSVELRHEEHDTIVLDPGYYIQRIVKEYDHVSGRTRGVLD